MRVVFFGTSVFATPALRALAPYVTLVVSQPDRPSGRGMRLHPSPVKRLAFELGLPVETPEKSRSPDFLERLAAEHADVLVVAAYGQILSQRVLDTARYGGINLHGSILPAYRGAAPIQRCLLAGDTQTGVTLMQMDRGMDTGDMIDTLTLDIEPSETYGELQDRLAQAAAELIVSWLPRLCVGDYPRTAQDSARATMAPKVDKAEAELNFSELALQEFNRYRAFTPEPGAFVRTRLGALRLAKASLTSQELFEKVDRHGSEPQSRLAPGTVVGVSPKLRLAFGAGVIDFDEVRPEGKKGMSGADFANGARLKVGDRLI